MGNTHLIHLSLAGTKHGPLPLCSLKIAPSTLSCFPICFQKSELLLQEDILTSFVSWRTQHQTVFANLSQNVNPNS